MLKLLCNFLNETLHVFNGRISKFYLMHTTNDMNIINLIARITEGSDNRGSTVYVPVIHHW